jgi:YbbR domain-containing protein
MPFRELDEESGRVARLQREARSWLRRIFVEDWNLKLLALAITLGLWFGVTGQRAPATIRLRGVQLNFQLPANMEISNDPRTEVEVTLTGSKRDLERINSRDLVAYVDVSDRKPGERVVQLTPGRVQIELPEGVRIDDIEPSTVPLRLEPRVEREVEVEARLEGNPPEGYELRAINITPNKVRVRGPASHVNELQKALTETIPLEGRTESFAIAQTAIDITDQKVDVIDTIVNVYLEIGEQRIEKSFAGVAVRESSTGAAARPETASVTVYGARSAIEKLRSEEMQLALDVSEDGAITPRLVLPPDMQGRVELRSTKPAGFTIIR